MKAGHKFLEEWQQGCFDVYVVEVAEKLKINSFWIICTDSFDGLNICFDFEEMRLWFSTLFFINSLGNDRQLW